MVAREAMTAGFVAFFPKPLQTTFPHHLLQMMNRN
jgi:hypothetical protein